MSDIIRVLLCLAASGFAFLSMQGWAFHYTAGPAHGAGAEMGIIGGICSIGLATVVLRWREPKPSTNRSAERTTRDGAS